MVSTTLCSKDNNLIAGLYGRKEKDGRRTHYESSEQRALIKWAALVPIVHQHLIVSANGGKRDVYEGYKLKQQGVKAGIPDLFLAYPVAPYHGLWIELKRPLPHLSKLSNNQRSWLDVLRAAGFAVFVAQGWLKARDIIVDYLGDKLHDKASACRHVRDAA